MFSPAYDDPQRLETVKRWMEEAGMKSVKAAFIPFGKEKIEAPVVKGIKP